MNFTPSVDPSMHTRAPADRAEEIVWAYLDTAYNLIRESAVRLLLEDMRSSAAEVGIQFPATDEELFADMNATAAGLGEEGPKNHLDLAPHSDAVATALDLTFQAFYAEARKYAREALEGEL